MPLLLGPIEPSSSAKASARPSEASARKLVSLSRNSSLRTPCAKSPSTTSAGLRRCASPERTVPSRSSCASSCPIASCASANGASAAAARGGRLAPARSAGHRPTRASGLRRPSRSRRRSSRAGLVVGGHRKLVFAYVDWFSRVFDCARADRSIGLRAFVRWQSRGSDSPASSAGDDHGMDRCSAASLTAPPSKCNRRSQNRHMPEQRPSTRPFRALTPSCAQAWRVPNLAVAEGRSIAAVFSNSSPVDNPLFTCDRGIRTETGSVPDPCGPAFARSPSRPHGSSRSARITPAAKENRRATDPRRDHLAAHRLDAASAPAIAGARALLLSGSTSMFPLVTQLAALYHKDTHQPAPRVGQGTSGAGHRRSHRRTGRHRRRLARPDHRSRPQRAGLHEDRARRALRHHQQLQPPLQPQPAARRRDLHGTDPQLERSPGATATGPIDLYRPRRLLRYPGCVRGHLPRRNPRRSRPAPPSRKRRAACARR